jgi:hypothetical protein
MAEQFAGVASVAVAVLAYLVVVEALTAAAVLLAQFIALQVRSLRGALLGEPPRPAGEVHQARAGESDQQPAYRLGGDLRWH